MTAEQGLLLEKARRSLQAAQLLADKGFYEFSVSRAYYAMFYAAEAMLLMDGLSYSKHSAVVAALGKHFVKTGRIPPELHDYLIKAQSGRHAGDYDTSHGLSQSHADMHITRAREFLNVAANLISTSGQGPQSELLP